MKTVSVVVELEVKTEVPPGAVRDRLEAALYSRAIYDRSYKGGALWHKIKVIEINEVEADTAEVSDAQFEEAVRIIVRDELKRINPFLVAALPTNNDFAE